MKHITILLAFLIAGITSIYAQEINSGADYNDLAAKLEKNNKALDNPKKSADPKFWLDRAKLFQEIADVNTQILRAGISEKELILFCKEPKEKKQTNVGVEYVYDRFIVILKDGKVEAWKETKNIVPNPLQDALNSYKKAVELDAEKKLDKKVGEGLKSLKSQYLKNAINCYNLKDSLCTYQSFKTIVEINEMKQVNVVDTTILFNAGLTAINAGAYDDAVKYLTDVVKMKYMAEPTLFTHLKRAYMAKKDTVNALNALKQGIAVFPNDINIIIELINYYITTNDSKTALEYIAKAKQNDPKNKSFFYVEAYLYDKMSNVSDNKISELDAARKAEMTQLDEEKKAEWKKTGNSMQKYKPIDDKFKKLKSDVELKYKAKEDSLIQVSADLQNKSVGQYKQAIEIDPTYFEAYYNLGVLYFNNGLRWSEQAGKESDETKYQAKKNASDEAFKKAVPYMEQAYEVTQKVKATPQNASDIKKNRDTTLDVLKALYYRLRMDDQFMRIKKLQEQGQ